MTYTNVQVRAGPLPKYLVQSVAEFGHTIQEILEMIASCILVSGMQSSQSWVLTQTGSVAQRQES